MSLAEPIQSGFLEVPGARLYYEHAGEGEPVVFLHGGLLDGRMWDDQFQFFAEQYQALRFDARRSGKSEDAPSAEPSVYVPYQDVSHLLRTLALEKASLVGFSGGARAAIDLAIAHPEMVQKLVAVSPGLSGYEFVDAWTRQRNEEFAAAISQGNLARAVEVALSMWAYGPSRSPEQIAPATRARMQEMVTRALSQGILSLMMQMHELEPPAVTRLAEIEASTLIVLGEKDTSDIHTIGKLLHEHVPGSELVLMPNTAHPLTMEKPEEFNTLLARFLRRA